MKRDGPMIFWLCLDFVFGFFLVKWFQFSYFAVIWKEDNDMERLHESANAAAPSFRNLPARLSIAALFESFISSKSCFDNQEVYIFGDLNIN